MRQGDNPNKINTSITSKYVHQVIVPVYIPNEEGYFKDSFAIFKLCIQSLINTTHSDTYITIINNGSCDLVVNYLDNLLREKKIAELIHTTNIGKINAVLKGLVGLNAEIVTVSDQDILFQKNWQEATLEVFTNFPKAGTVGLIPMFRSHRRYCDNILFDNLFSNKLKFRPVLNPNGMIKFYESIWITANYNKNYLKRILTLTSQNGKIAIVGAGHLVASYRKSVYNSLEFTHTADLLSTESDKNLLDLPALKLDYYRLTTYDNYAFHMGNSFELWMNDGLPKEKTTELNTLSVLNQQVIKKNNLILKLKYRIKYIFVKRIVFSKFFYKKFLKMKCLEEEYINNF